MLEGMLILSHISCIFQENVNILMAVNSFEYVKHNLSNVIKLTSH